MKPFPQLSQFILLSPRMRRGYLRRAGGDAQTRELILIAADLLAAPHPNESQSLRLAVITRAEAKLLPHAALLRWYLYKNWLWKFAPLVLVIFHVVLFIFTACGIGKVFFSRATIENKIEATTTSENLPFVKSKTTETNASRATEINSAEKVASLALIATFIKGELPHHLGETREALAAPEQLTRDVLAAALRTLAPDSEMMKLAADAMCENHLGIAWSIITGALRTRGIDPLSISPQKIALAPSLSLAEASEQIALTLLEVNAKDTFFQAESARTRGGKDQDNLENLENYSARTINPSRKSTWGELPPLRETLRARSEIPLLPPEYWSSVREFLQQE